MIKIQVGEWAIKETLTGKFAVKKQGMTVQPFESLYQAMVFVSTKKLSKTEANTLVEAINKLCASNKEMKDVAEELIKTVKEAKGDL